MNGGEIFDGTIKASTRKTSRSGEDYLEAILVVNKKNGEVHPVDLASYLNYAKPSITNAVFKIAIELKGEKYP